MQQSSGVQHHALARIIASILKNGLDRPDKAESQPAQIKANSYGITRGAAYFRKGGDR